MESITDFFGNFNCYSICLTNSQFYDTIILSFLFIFAFAVVYLLTKSYVPLFSSQSSATAFILLNIFAMKCQSLQWLWTYSSIILIGVFLISLTKVFTQRELNNSVRSFGFLKEMEKKFNAKMFVLNTQKFKAFAFNKKIYLSVGLLEVLNKNETLAVVSHEVYHVKNSPNKILANFLAISSLSFRTYDDELNADKFAIEIAGFGNWKNALIKLNVKNWEKRIRRLN